MLIDPALIALSNETTCTTLANSNPNTTAPLPSATATSAVRPIPPLPDLGLEPSSGPTRLTSVHAGEFEHVIWTHLD
jgi:hypothetical protein